MKRSTKIAKEMMEANDVASWVAIIKLRQAEWMTRLSKLDLAKLAKQVYELLPVGFRKRGRPRKRWCNKEHDSSF